ncbi:hypothetical protein SAMN06296386_11643 [Lachnospiraceae bacterium]|nr:hypothetical protein SAMN06296386_11643 [Lachnospiraceae bacterium]
MRIGDEPAGVTAGSTYEGEIVNGYQLSKTNTKEILCSNCDVIQKKV